jgi:hypothetical protein
MVELSISLIIKVIVLVAAVLVVAVLLGIVNIEGVEPVKGNTTYRMECEIWNAKGCKERGEPYIPSKLQEEVEQCLTLKGCIEYCEDIGTNMENCLW